MKTLLFWLLLACPANTLLAQEEKTIELSELLKAIIRERQSPATYEYSFTMSVIYGGETSQGIEGSEVEVTGIVKLDEPAERVLVDYRSRLVSAFSLEQASERSSSLYKEFPNVIRLRSPALNVNYNVDEDRVTARDPSKDVFSELPIDLRTIGLSRIGSRISRGMTLEECIQVMTKDYGKVMCKISEDGIATLDLRNEIFRVDTNKEFWPLERVAFEPDIINGKKVRIESQSQRMKLIQVDSRWVPEKIAVRTHSIRLDMDLKWKSYDRPFGRGAFDFDENIKRRKEQEKAERVKKE